MIVCMVQKRSGSFFKQNIPILHKIDIQSVKASAQTQEGPTCWCLRMMKAEPFNSTRYWIMKGCYRSSTGNSQNHVNGSFPYIPRRQATKACGHFSDVFAVSPGWTFYFAEFYTSLIALFSVELLLSALCGKESEGKVRTCRGWNQGRYGTTIGLGTCLKLSSSLECLEVEHIKVILEN